MWIVRGGLPRKAFNVYFVRDTHSAQATTACSCSTPASRGWSTGWPPRARNSAGSRGSCSGTATSTTAAPLRACAAFPCYCHPDNVADATGDGGIHYADLSKIARPARWLYPTLLSSWDGGPVEIDGTIAEGDDVAGFEAVLLPGHAPGQIGLWRASDRLALTSDCFYTANPERFTEGPPMVPHRAFNLDHEQAIASVRKLAALEPAAAWPGHADPLTGDVRAQLEAAADRG